MAEAAVRAAERGRKNRAAGGYGAVLRAGHVRDGGDPAAVFGDGHPSGLSRFGHQAASAGRSEAPGQVRG